MISLIPQPPTPLFQDVHMVGFAPVCLGADQNLSAVVARRPRWWCVTCLSLCIFNLQECRVVPCPWCSTPGCNYYNNKALLILVFLPLPRIWPFPSFPPRGGGGGGVSVSVMVSYKWQDRRAPFLTEHDLNVPLILRVELRFTCFWRQLHLMDCVTLTRLYKILPPLFTTFLAALLPGTGGCHN